MIYDFDRVVDRMGTHTFKWDNMKHYFGSDGLLPLWVADMDFESPPEVREALVERAGHGFYGYTFIPDSAYTAVTEWLESRHNWSVDRDSLHFMPGVMPAVASAVHTFTEPGDSIVIQPPVYFPFFSVVKMNNRVLLENNLVRDESGTYRMDMEDLEDKLKNGAKMLILCSPHNPVGRVWTREELTGVRELCRRYGTILLSDEIHHDLTAPGVTHTPVLSLPGDPYEKTITCTGPTKTFNLPCLSISYMVMPDEKIRKKFKKFINGFHIHGINIFGALAMEKAYIHGAPWLDNLLVYVQRNMETVSRWFSEHDMPVSFTRPEGTYLLWLDFSDVCNDHDKFFRILVEKGRVGLNSGLSFGEPGRCFFRLNAACPEKILLEGLERIGLAVKECL